MQAAGRPGAWGGREEPGRTEGGRQLHFTPVQRGSWYSLVVAVGRCLSLFLPFRPCGVWDLNLCHYWGKGMVGKHF